MSTRTITLTEEQEQFILETVESGRFPNANEVVSAALRDLEDKQKLASLREAFAEGEASGIAEGEVFGRLRAEIKTRAARK